MTCARCSTFTLVCACWCVVLTIKTEGPFFRRFRGGWKPPPESLRLWRFFAISSSARCSSGRLRRAANDPPASADHLDDDEWHAAQDMWLVKWSGSVLFDGLLQYGCSVLGGAPMVAAERQCRARQAGTAQRSNMLGALPTRWRARGDGKCCAPNPSTVVQTPRQR